MGKKFTSDKPSTAEILRLKKPNERSCEILLDPELGRKIREKENELEKVEARKRRSRDLATPGPEGIQAELDALYEEAADAYVTFTFRDIGKKKYDALIMAHPPSEDDIKQWEMGGGQGKLAYSITTFPAALISVTSTEPKITPEEATSIWEEWGAGDIETLFITAMAACMEKTSIPLSRRGSGRTTASDLSLTTALNGESDTADS